ncbi:hypothetical protein QEG73_00050 [Chitinophagaceae bacterium 26-R-25]|nr:hypothetical protein [Chitinophagaceae bacterium 26-R-25]
MPKINTEKRERILRLFTYLIAIISPLIFLIFNWIPKAKRRDPQPSYPASIPPKNANLDSISRHYKIETTIAAEKQKSTNKLRFQKNQISGFVPKAPIFDIIDNFHDRLDIQAINLTVENFLCVLKDSNFNNIKNYKINNPDWLSTYMLLSSEKVLKIKLLEETTSTTNLTSTKSSCKECEIDDRSDNYNLDLSIIKPSFFGKYYLFDVFRKDSNCMHGNKVMDVVRQTLATYKVDQSIILNNVDSLPVNYFSNIIFADSIIEEYRKTSGHFLEKVTDEMKSQYQNNDDHAPAVYLAALYQKYCDSTPDIVSSSFVVDSQFPFFEMAATVDSVGYKTNFFTAASNDTSSIELFLKQSRRTGEEPQFTEPIKDFVDRSVDLGTFIVGNQISIDSFAGGYSQTGTKATILGKGNHWGMASCTRCILFDRDVGTSYATPEVATKLFIAKAFWRMYGITLDAKEARIRMLMATNLNKRFVGKFASAGSIDMRKLLQIKAGYLVNKNDSIIVVDSIDNSYFTNDIINGQPQITRFTSIPIDNQKTIRSIYAVDDKVFAFFNDEKSIKWEEMPKPKILLHVRLEGTDKLITIKTQDFYNNYKQFVTLNYIYDE